MAKPKINDEPVIIETEKPKEITLQAYLNTLSGVKKDVLWRKFKKLQNDLKTIYEWQTIIK